MKYQTLILVAAYGKQYTNAEQAKQAWVDGKDFRVYPTSTYCSIRDMPTLQQHFQRCDIINAHGILYTTFGE